MPGTGERVRRCKFTRIPLINFNGISVMQVRPLAVNHRVNRSRPRRGTLTDHAFTFTTRRARCGYGLKSRGLDGRERQLIVLGLSFHATLVLLRIFWCGTKMSSKLDQSLYQRYIYVSKKTTIVHLEKKKTSDPSVYLLICVGINSL